MRFKPIALIIVLAAFATSAQSQEYLDARNHLFPAQMMFEVSIPFGGANSDAVEFSLKFNNFNNLSTRSVLARFNQNGKVDIPIYNNFGQGAVDWAKANPWLAIGVGVAASYGIANTMIDWNDGVDEEDFACLAIFPIPPECL